MNKPNWCVRFFCDLFVKKWKEENKNICRTYKKSLFDSQGHKEPIFFEILIAYNEFNGSDGGAREELTGAQDTGDSGIWRRKYGANNSEKHPISAGDL